MTCPDCERLSARIAELEAELTAAHAALDAWETFGNAVPWDYLRDGKWGTAGKLATKARELRARREGGYELLQRA